ncbi:DUF2059 domain-containing protein [Fulvimarina endophytica]|uniref:DUF2059 domain-containing protein n=1 Tax=Fulvimarina endophytica TaxID=2293836 RepID=A0A371X756_9HYPH|nr:DUF2059 domain-containing protein [Fulvimarina endophytica]RFC65070.1 DUF2059 domain-containing protein [Fulvimarina endophytica]
MRTKDFVSALGAIALLGTALATTPSFAQDAGAAPAASEQQQPAEISESHLAAARKAVDAIGASDEFDNILLNAATQTKAEFIPNNPDLQTEISDMVDEKAIELAPRRAALETEIARAYASLFTEEELNEIAGFYSTEAGRKLLELGPRAARESLGAANVWTNGILRDLRQASLEGMNEIYAAQAGETPAPAEGAAEGAAEGGSPQ